MLMDWTIQHHHKKPTQLCSDSDAPTKMMENPSNVTPPPPQLHPSDSQNWVPVNPQLLGLIFSGHKFLYF